METILAPPFVTRLYPSPRTGQEITVHVKEVDLDEYPRKFPAQHLQAAHEIGNHLISTDVRGMRAWTPQEHVEAAENFDTLPREHPWMEIWEIGTTDQIAVLDVIMYTEFYTDKTIDRFRRFVAIALPLIRDCGALIMEASKGGASLHLKKNIKPADFRRVAESVMDFNAAHFSVEMPRAQVLRSFSKSKALWFGYC